MAQSGLVKWREEEALHAKAHLGTEETNKPGNRGAVRPSGRWTGFGMATAEQLKALLKSYAEGDDERFLAISMQVAAHAARKGQGKLAEELRALIDEAKARRDAAKLQHPVPIARATGELAGLLLASYPKVRLSDMV